MAAKIHTDKDADLKNLKGKTVAVIGFGSQGHAHALNLKDSGVKVLIGLYPGSKSRAVAKKHGFTVLDTAEAVKKADVVFVAVPDTKIAEVYNQDIAPHLQPGKTLLFSHGFAIHFKTIKPPKDIDVIMVAPKGPGHIVRRQFLEGKGVPTLIAVYQNPSKQAKKTALAWAKGIGGTRGGVIETTFKEETETDLFGEQAVLCGGASALVQAGYETLVEAGYPPESIRVAPIESCVGEARDLVAAGIATVSLVGENGLFHSRGDRWPHAVQLARAVSVARAVRTWVRDRNRNR